MKRTPILLDTNILMAIADGVDVYGQLEERYPHLEPTILEGSLDELAALEQQGPAKQRRAAKLAREVAQRQHLNMAVQSAEHVDDALLAAAERLDAHLATIDRELQRRARSAGIPVLTIKRRSRLEPAYP